EVFLVQFNGPLDPGKRAELKAAGVELLKYVPEDAFIAKFNKVSPSSIAAKNFVTWVGPYRAEHKIHPRLAAAIKEAAKTNSTLKVNILLAPSATSPGISAVRSLLASVHSESHLRQGTILRAELTSAQLDALTKSGD